MGPSLQSWDGTGIMAGIHPGVCSLVLSTFQEKGGDKHRTREMALMVRVSSLDSHSDRREQSPKGYPLLTHICVHPR